MGDEAAGRGGVPGLPGRKPAFSGSAAGAVHEQLWAAAHHVPDPQYGLTSILDISPEQIPHAIERTVSDLDPARLLPAAQHLAGMLSEIGRHLPDDQRAILPEAMARYVTNDLQQLVVKAQV